MFVAALALALGSVAALFLLPRERFPAPGRTSRVLAALAGALGLAVGGALVVHVVREGTGPDHSLGELWWPIWITAAAVLGAALLLAGTLHWGGRSAWRLRFWGFAALLLATAGSMSFVLPLLTPVALLALPSLFVPDRRRDADPPRAIA